MPSRHLYIFIGQSFVSMPDIAREVLGDTLATSLKLSRNKVRAGLAKVAVLAIAQIVAIMWAIDAWLMLLVAFAITVKQIQKIKELNIDLASYISYAQLANEKVLNYGRHSSNFPVQTVVRPLHKSNPQ